MILLFAFAAGFFHFVAANKELPKAANMVSTVMTFVSLLFWLFSLCFFEETKVGNMLSTIVFSFVVYVAGFNIIVVLKNKTTIK